MRRKTSQVLECDQRGSNRGGVKSCLEATTWGSQVMPTGPRLWEAGVAERAVPPGQRSGESLVTEMWAPWEDWEGRLGAQAEARPVLGVLGASAGGGAPGTGAMGEG